MPRIVTLGMLTLRFSIPTFMVFFSAVVTLATVFETVVSVGTVVDSVEDSAGVVSVVSVVSSVVVSEVSDVVVSASVVVSTDVSEGMLSVESPAFVHALEDNRHAVKRCRQGSGFFDILNHEEVESIPFHH